MGVLTISESGVGQLFASVQFAMRPNTAMLCGRSGCGSTGDRQVWQIPVWCRDRVNWRSVAARGFMVPANVG